MGFRNMTRNTFEILSDTTDYTNNMVKINLYNGNGKTLTRVEMKFWIIVYLYGEGRFQVTVVWLAL